MLLVQANEAVLFEEGLGVLVVLVSKKFHLFVYLVSQLFMHILIID
jgi:hypothetical protein